VRDRLIHSRFFELVCSDGAGPTPRVRVEARGSGLYTLRIEGAFPDGWCGQLSIGLSRASLSVVRGFARRIDGGGWVSEFHLLSQDGFSDPRTLDALAIAGAPAAPGPPAPITLDSYYVDGSPESGPYVFLEVRGPDRMGFLGSLLERLRSIWLFPEQMSVETWAGQARDTFYLRSARPGARLRSEDAARELAVLLEPLRGAGGDARSAAAIAKGGSGGSARAIADGLGTGPSDPP
jgi:hypothetical protein